MENKIFKMRIPKELQQIAKTQKQHGISCAVDSTAAAGSTQSQLLATIPGPKGSPYENGIFKVSIVMGAQYPFRPPTFKFLTPVFHPNIDNAGNICLDLLRMPPNGSYNPAITLESILLSIQLLLASPNPDDPLQQEAAELFKTNPTQFNQRAKDLILKHQNPAQASHNDEIIQTNEAPRKRGKLEL